MVDPLAALLPVGAEARVLAAIWATVDTDRVLARLALPGTDLPDDSLLGARVTLVEAPDGEPHDSGAPGGEPIVLLEPLIEGRMAATLARRGEGPAGRYVVATDGLDAVLARALASGIGMSEVDAGPFGRSVLVLDEGPAGPHLILVEPSAGTIDR